MFKGDSLNVHSLAEHRKKVKKRADDLVIEHLSLVKIVAKKIIMKLPSNVDLDDLISAGTIGLMDAANKFNSKKDVKFKTYAEHRIRGAIIDELRAQDWVPRSIRNKEKFLEKKTKEIQAKHGRYVTLCELRKELDLKSEEFDHLVESTKKCKLLPIDQIQHLNEEDKGYIRRYINEQSGSNPLEKVSFSSSQNYIQRSIGNLNQSEQTVMQLYYFESKNLKEISTVLGITESRVSQLHMRAKSKLKDVLYSHFSSYTDMVA